MCSSNRESLKVQRLSKVGVVKHPRYDVPNITKPPLQKRFVAVGCLEIPGCCGLFAMEAIQKIPGILLNTGDFGGEGGI